MTKIYLIRHAEAEGNLYRRIQGHWDGSITPLGLQQIDALAQRFRREHIDALYCSDLSRARATAEAITRYHDIPAVATPRLTEICMGVWEGRAWGDVEHEFPEQMRYFNTDPDRWSVPGCEPFRDVQKRMKRAISDLAARHDGQTIALVSHGMAIRSLLAHILGVASRDIPSLPHGDNTAVSKLIFDNGAFSVAYYNDNSHLPPELSTFARQSWWKKETRGADPNNLYYEPLDPNREGETYKEFYAASWKAAHRDLKGFYPETYLASARRHFAANGKAILKAYRSDGELAGIVETDTERSEGAGVGWISLVYIKEHLRGRGLGTQLVGRAITNYEMLGRQKVRLHVSSENASAIKFYEDLGFEILGSEPGAGAPLYLMEKRFE